MEKIVTNNRPRIPPAKRPAPRDAGGFPRKEIFGLTFQFRHAAISIASNLVEGSKPTDEKTVKKNLTQPAGKLWVLIR
jgi:hypothetical protein